VILIETVGAGQTEVAIAELADTIALVTVPGLGDAVQAIKAGLMEVADMVVVNMADRPGTPETVKHLRLTLGRELPIATTVATNGTGVEELRALFDARWSTLGSNGHLAGLRVRKRARESALIAEAFTRACAARIRDPSPDLNTAVKEILEEAARRWTT
jgi:LAO/AO transport system kinase